MPTSSRRAPSVAALAIAAKFEAVMASRILALAGVPDEIGRDLLRQDAEMMMAALVALLDRGGWRPLDPATAAAAVDITAAKAIAEWIRVQIAAGSAGGGGHA